MRRSVIGPKAESLRRMTEAGLPVPEARFLDTDAYREHAARSGLDTLVSDEAGTLLDSGVARGAILGTAIDPKVEHRLRRWYDELGGGHLTVRSSADAEDLPNASFAGQHGTYFVAGADELVERVRDCWASLYSERAVRYRERAGMGHTGIAMAVIIQRLVRAEAAGVAFTVSPLDGADEIWIEACLGLGEALVSGKVTPDRFVLARDGRTILERSAGDKHVRVVETDVGTREIPLVGRDASDPCIEDDVARQVAALALRAERVFGVPVDVEWAVESGEVWILQARPVTVLGRSHDGEAPTVSAEGTAGAADTIWSNVNTGEILPDVATPMTWSIIHGHAGDIFGGMFAALGVHVDASKLVGLVGGRVYFNASMLRESFAHFPGMDPDQMLGGMHDYIELPPLGDVRGRPSVPALLRAGAAFPWYFLKHRPVRAATFAARMRASTEARLRDIAARPDLERAVRLLTELEGRFAEYSEALAYMAVSMFGFMALGAVCRRWLGDASGTLANRLVAGCGDVGSAQAGHAMWRLGSAARESTAVSGPVLTGAGWADVRERLEKASVAGEAPAKDFLEAWDAFMAEHGHHRRGELELANPTWAEQPDYVLKVVRSYLVDDRSADPVAAFAARADEAGLAAAESRGRLRGPLQRALFDRALAWGRASAGARENLKSETVRWLVAIRKALLLVAERLVERGDLGSPEDVFFLTFGELLETARRPRRDLRGTIAARRTEHARLEALSPPPVVVGAWDESAARWSVPGDARVLKGISVSSGVARGPARVFTDSGTDEAVLPGEILVAPFGDPGWTPYFVPAAGIVMDMGGLLSHGSIIAREYGIPAVVNVGPATRIVTTGRIVEVDGDKGEVRILD